MPVTIMDVAKEANVSKSTVSLVMNNSDSVKLETRIKVLEAIERLGYVPNMAARELTTKIKHILGLIFMTDNTTNKSYRFDSVTETLLYDTFNGISSGMKQTDFGLLSERFSAFEATQELPSLIKNNRVDGVFIVGGLFDDSFMQRLLQRKIAAVLVGRSYPGIDWVAPDVLDAMYKGTKYLLETGHKHIAFILGPRTSPVAHKKLEGIRKALDEAGMALEDNAVKYCDYTGASGYTAMKELWESGVRTDSVFAASDGIAVGAMRYLYDQRVRIPDDISIVGYEQSVITEHAFPALTTIDINKERMGEEALRILLNRIARPKAKPVQMTLAPSLVIRDTVKLRG
ncbi:LacI family transcriptional regulator [Paenibacillus sp. H1-7]|uniref:LacI family DNA-binding transcriptional regulator n=1 Tax=Paenibacillus sp. H1-7 TaxID=2282849 RepID=UPI001EF9959E|nr:LacI family DNA-binding transcriptional regulator [Paenibacillus sp. H1-7]ULL15199.1 LacI family transcriptional regulator [Paenibacillus sp. H1-7]